MLMQIDSPAVHEIVRTGRRNHFRFRPLRRADPITQPVFNGNVKIPRWIIPRQESHVYIPREADRGMELIKSRLTVVQEVVLEEAPRLLAAPKVDVWAEKQEKLIKASNTFGRVVYTAFKLAAGATAVIGYLAVSALLIDPALIAIVRVEDGRYVWIEVAQWYT